MLTYYLFFFDFVRKNSDFSHSGPIWGIKNLQPMSVAQKIFVVRGSGFVVRASWFGFRGSGFGVRGSGFVVRGSNLAFASFAGRRNRLFKALSFKKKEIFPHVYSDARGNISFFLSIGFTKRVAQNEW